MSVHVFLQSTQKEKGEENPCMDMSCFSQEAVKFDVGMPFSQAFGQSKPRGDDLRHPTSWKGGHSLLFTSVSFYHWAFMSKFPQGPFPQRLRK